MPDERRYLEALVGKIHEEIAVMQKVVDRLEKTVYGGNGTQGLSDQFDKKFGERIARLERFMWLAVGALGAMQFFTGSGAFSFLHLVAK